MSKNPIVNAFSATAYIVAVASLMYYGLKSLEHDETVLIPIAMLSLFVLSAAVMGFIFFYQPAQLYLNGETARALDLFLKTLGAFACITLAIFTVLFLMNI